MTLGALPLSVTGSLASTVGQKNPIRYRGYYYDTETGLYYLQSRYYDPVVGRFLNGDAIMGVNPGMTTYNLFVIAGITLLTEKILRDTFGNIVVYNMIMMAL